jgi:hypothetical protein
LIRRLFTLAALLSLALSVAAACVWPRTRRQFDGIACLGADDVRYSVHSSPGGVCFERTDNFTRRHDPHDPEPVKEGWSVTSRPWGWSRRYTWIDSPPAVYSGPSDGGVEVYNYVVSAHSVIDAVQWDPPPHGALGFGWGTTSQIVTVYWQMPGRVTAATGRFVVPLWFVSAVTGAPFVVSLVTAARRRMRDRDGRCRQCGYNLTANTSGVCPECGTAIPAEAKP